MMLRNKLKKTKAFFLLASLNIAALSSCVSDRYDTDVEDSTTSIHLKHQGQNTIDLISLQVQQTNSEDTNVILFSTAANENPFSEAMRNQVWAPEASASPSENIEDKVEVAEVEVVVSPEENTVEVAEVEVLASPEDNKVVVAEVAAVVTPEDNKVAEETLTPSAEKAELLLLAEENMSFSEKDIETQRNVSEHIDVFIGEDENDITIKKMALSKKKELIADAQGDNDKGVYYIVYGDSLSKIAQKIYGAASRWHDIAKLNNIDEKQKIYAGDMIYYHKDDMSERIARNEGNNFEEKSVIVKKGDDLSSLSQKLLGSAKNWRVLWKENAYIKNPDLLYPGSVIKYKVVLPASEQRSQKQPLLTQYNYKKIDSKIDKQINKKSHEKQHHHGDPIDNQWEVSIMTTPIDIIDASRL